MSVLKNIFGKLFNNNEAELTLLKEQNELLKKQIVPSTVESDLLKAELDAQPKETPKQVKKSVTVKETTTEPKAKISRQRLTPEVIQERNEHLFNLGYIVQGDLDAQTIISYTGRPCQHKASKIYLDYKGQKQIGISFSDYINFWNKLGKMVQRNAIKEFNAKQVKTVQTAVHTAVVKEIKDITTPKATIKPKQPTQAELDAKTIADLKAKLERFNKPKGTTKRTATAPKVTETVKTPTTSTKKNPTTENELKDSKLANLTKKSTKKVEETV